jgi:hypothetical protein
MFFETAETFELDVARPTSEPIIEVDENVGDVWLLEDVFDVEEEGKLFCGKYRYMTKSRFDRLTREE